MGSFSEFAKKYANGKVAIGMHRNADLDALCSAYALGTIFPNSVLVTPDDMNAPAKGFARDFGISAKDFGKADKKLFDGLIVVDCGTYAMMKDARGWKVLCLIDHHQKSSEEERIIAETEVWDPSSPSTCQLVAELLEAEGKMAGKVAFALAVGIISDTARFKSGNLQSFGQMAKLLKISGKTYADALAYAEPEREADEKVSLLAALQSVQSLTYKNFVIATTTVHSNESDASSALSEIADVVFAASWKEREKTSRVSARARKHVPIAMNKIMAEIGKEFSASGGGHAKAAGANAKERPEKVLKRCVECVKDALDGIEV